MNSVFNEQILGEKLSKLNSTQQCIETLSHWCIFHRSKAELVATTWDKQFHSADMVQKVPLLYLANDILQNSKRKGNEFVIAFWKVLPAATKEVSANGDDRGKKTVLRLVNIWEERRVFGSRVKSLRDVMLGKELPGPLEFGKKRPRSVKIVKRDSRSIRTKLTIGEPVERIVSAFHLVLSDHSSEVEEMTNCKFAVDHIRKMEKDVEMALAKAKDPKRKSLAREMGDEETLLKRCIEKLKVVEANRVALVSQLREVLHEQESELENVRTQMQVAQAEADEAGNMKKHLEDESYVEDSKLTNKKSGAAAIAAEVADKLAASSSSQFIMSSVLSTFAAEEEAKRATGSSTSLPTNNSMSKQEQPLPDSNVFIPAVVQPAINNPPYHLPPQVANSQPHYHSLPQQYMHPGSGMVSSYYYGSVPPPLPPPPQPAAPSYMVSPMVPFTQQHQQPPAPPSFRPGMVYYSHPHHPQ